VKKYTREERRRAAIESYDVGAPLLAAQLGVHTNSIYTWRKKYLDEMPTTLHRARAMLAEANEKIRELEAEIERLSPETRRLERNEFTRAARARVLEIATTPYGD
jgi:transposase-like protein